MVTYLPVKVLSIMSISVTQTRESYDGNGSTSTVYQIPWAYFSQSHNKVYADGVDITNTVSFTGDGSVNTGGFYTSSTAYAATVDVVAVLDMPLDQPTILIEGGALPAKVIERQGFDRLGMQIRTVDAKTGNTLRAPISDVPLDELPIASERLSKVLGFDETTGQPLLTYLDTLNSAAALDAAVASAEDSKNAAETAEDNALASETAAGVSEGNAANSAISAKGFITISALALSDIPTAYPTDQASVMAVDTTGGGGTWPHAGMVFTHVFTDVGFDTTYEQIFVPASTTTGKFTQVRHGITSGAAWSTFAEWNDALSKSEGGTVTGDTTFTGDLEASNTAFADPTSGDQVLTKKGEEINNIVSEPLYFTNTTPYVVGCTYEITTDTWTGFKDLLKFNSVGIGDIAHYEFAPTAVLTTDTQTADQIFVVPFFGSVATSNILRMTLAVIASPYGELVGTDDGVQVDFEGDAIPETTFKYVTIRLAKNNTLYTSPKTVVDSTSTTMCIMLERDGKISLWNYNEDYREMSLIYRDPTLSHPWTTTTLVVPHAVDVFSGGSNATNYFKPAFTKLLRYPQQ